VPQIGLLPLDITSEDTRRQFHNLEQVDAVGPEEFARTQLIGTYDLADQYIPFSFWEDQQYYLQMLVEKIDLRELFDPVCLQFRVPIANAVGWSTTTSEPPMMGRFQFWERRGKTPCFCTAATSTRRCPDKRQSQIHIAELERAVGWSPENLIIDRFGLNQDFIEANGLSWSDNLITSSGNDLADPRHRITARSTSASGSRRSGNARSRPTHWSPVPRPVGSCAARRSASTWIPTGPKNRLKAGITSGGSSGGLQCDGAGCSVVGGIGLMTTTTSGPAKPKWLPVNPAQIPLELRELNQWVLWWGVWLPERNKWISPRGGWMECWPARTSPRAGARSQTYWTLCKADRGGSTAWGLC